MSDSSSLQTEQEESDSESYDKLNPAQLADKLHGLKRLWAGTRISTGDSSVAEWLPKHGLAVVQHQRGALLQRMGIMCRGRLYLTIEELIFLVDRGSMVAVCGSGANSKVLSRQECYCIMDSIGVPMDAFLTYCFLQRAGYVVRRCPCIWTINEGRLVDVHRHWASAWQDSARIWAANGPTPHSTDGSSPQFASDAPAGSASTLNGSSGSSHHAPIPDLHSVQTKFPDGRSSCAPALSLLKPTDNFSRKCPGPVDAEVVVGDANATGIDAQLLCGSALPGDPKIMFSYVLGGDVIFTQGRRQPLQSLWRQTA